MGQLKMDFGQVDFWPTCPTGQAKGKKNIYVEPCDVGLRESGQSQLYLIVLDREEEEWEELATWEEAERDEERQMKWQGL